MHPDRFFSSIPEQRCIEHRLFAHVEDLPIKAETGFLPEGFLDPVSQYRADFEHLNFTQLITHQTPLCHIETFEDLKSANFGGRLLPLYVADCVTDPHTPEFVNNLDIFGTQTNCDAYTWKGYLEAHRIRREVFKLYGATAVLYHPPTAQTVNLDQSDMLTLFRKICIGKSTLAEAEHFRAAMHCEFAKMSVDDGLDLHIQAGGAQRINYTPQLKALLENYGNSTFKIVVLTHDETAVSTELAPLSSLYSALHLGLPSAMFNPYRLRTFRAITAHMNQTHPTYAFANSLQEMAITTDSIRRINVGCLALQVAQHEITEEAALQALIKCCT